MVILKESYNLPNISQYTDLLPSNYNFELPKTITNILRNKAKCVALQLPDGLLKFSIIISDCIQHYTGAETILLGDVVYGACNIDDETAYNLGADMLIHYGHSCLIPITMCRIKIMYVFVSIVFDVKNCIELVKMVGAELLEKEKSITENINCESSKKIENVDLQKEITGIENLEIQEYTDEVLKYIGNNFAIIGTVQFNNAIYQVSNLFKIHIPQIKPLSPGEILGCTSPRISKPVVIYISDGRFHLESAMIQNPTAIFYKYCPFTKSMTREFYDYKLFLETRKLEKEKAMKCKNVGVILSTLGRQGNEKILNNIINFMKNEGFIIYKLALKEINEEMLDYYNEIDCFIQVGCPRLSIDWGSNYKKPLLNAYEVFNDLREYTMDYYGREKDQLWNNY